MRQGEIIDLDSFAQGFIQIFVNHEQNNDILIDLMRKRTIRGLYLHRFFPDVIYSREIKVSTSSTSTKSPK